jgi:DNA-binding transcriptional ArsR family regulator
VSEDPITNINDPRYLKALSHPTRIRVLAILRERRASPNELSEMLGEGLGTVAYHVRTLKNLGLVKLVATRPRRGAIEHFYEAGEHPRFSDEAWGAASPIVKQRLLSAMLQQAGEYTANAAAAGGFDRKDAAITRHALKLDERGWKELARASKRWIKEMDAIETEAQSRLSEGDPHGSLDIGLVLMLFEAVPFAHRKAGQSGGARQRERRGVEQPARPAAG